MACLTVTKHRICGTHSLPDLTFHNFRGTKTPIDVLSLHKMSRPTNFYGRNIVSNVWSGKALARFFLRGVSTCAVVDRCKKCYHNNYHRYPCLLYSIKVYLAFSSALACYQYNTRTISCQPAKLSVQRSIIGLI